MTAEIVRYIGYDRAGIPRVYGESKQDDVAYTECMHAILDYVRGRPDMAPPSAWLIERE